MLLRSASTPVLSSLLGAIPQTEGLLESDLICESPVHPQSFRDFGFLKGFVSPSSPHLTVEDCRVVDGGDWDFNGDKVPWPTFRKVQSESDLQSLCRASSFCASFAAADSLLSFQEPPGKRDGICGGSRLQWSRPRRALKLRRHVSLSAIPSVSSEDSLDTDKETTLAEVPEVFTSETFVTACLDEAPPAEGAVLPLYSNLSQFQYLRLDESPMDSEVENNLLGKSFPQSNRLVNEFEDKKFSFNHTATGTFPASKSSSYTHHPSEQPCAVGGTPSSSGRNPHGVWESDFENRHSISVTGVNPTKVVHRNPNDENVGPMFIAGGFGMDGAGNGRLLCGRGNGGGDGDPLSTEEYYRKMLDGDPSNALFLRNYAKFLHEVKHDASKAEVYYERSILVNSSDGEVLALYAKLIWDTYRDEDRAGRYFEQALHAAPDDCYVVAAYAAFMWASESTAEDEEDVCVDHHRHPHTYTNMPSMYGSAYGSVAAASA